LPKELCALLLQTLHDFAMNLLGTLQKFLPFDIFTYIANFTIKLTLHL